MPRVVNHLMFATLTVFMIQQQLVSPSLRFTEGPWVAQALHVQPRTPPPTLEPEQVSGEEAEWMDNGYTNSLP